METEEDKNEPMEVNSEEDSADSDSADERVEQELSNRAEELERQLADNKYLYNIHEQLVSLYRKLGDLKSLRLAFERFHEYFPLTPELWLSWINDEKQIANTEAEQKYIFSLFDKAVEDYLSVNLWVEYAQYSIGASDLETTRSILERGLTAAGLHVCDGGLLWDTLRELEYVHLSLAQADSDQWKHQVAKIVEIFRRQLSVPLIGMENTYNEWKEWLKQLPQNHEIKTEPIEWGYKKALKLLETYRPFEDKLCTTSDETELLHIYKDYIKTLADPSTVLCVYERATAQLCLNIEIWLDYCSYAMKLGEAADKVTKKALRNCPWSEDLWVIRLRVLEQLGKNDSDVMTCFEQGYASLAANQGVELWLAYLEYLHRTSNNSEKLYKSFDHALEQLTFQSEGAAKVIKWYSRLLAKNGNMSRARQLWKSLLKEKRNRSCASLWLEFANLERQYGEPIELRALFQKAITTATDWPQCLVEEWRTFEREFGTLTDVIKCVEKCKGIVQIQPQLEDKIEDKKGQKRKGQDETEPIAKKSKSENFENLKKKIPILKDPKQTVFVSNLYPSINEKKLKKVFPNAVNIEIVVDRQGRSRCYGYVQFSMEEEVMTALARDRELLEGRPIFISACKPDRSQRHASFKYSNEKESNKLFVRGLPVDKTQEDIEMIFKPYGANSVRLVLHKSGQPKGLAYVEFVDEKTAKAAMQKTDQMKIGEHTITVAISAPPTKNKNQSGAALPQIPQRASKSKLQLPMIPRSLQVKSNSSTNGANAKSSQPKTNDDFRKMLLNK